jgi:hypothetical protein
MICNLAKRYIGIGIALLAINVVASPASAELIYATAHQGNVGLLLSWESNAPTNILSADVVRSELGGPPVEDRFNGIDASPVDGAMYVVGNSFMRRIKPNAQTSGGASLFPFPQIGFLSGFAFGVDVSPITGRMRVVSELNNNRTAATAEPSNALVEPNVFYAAGDPNFGVDPNIVDLAYTNSVRNAISTALYGIDTGLDALVTINEATGALTTVGPLGVDVSELGGFDISGASGTAYAALTPANASQSVFYTINLATGAAAPVGVVGGGIVVTGMTVFIPEPGSTAMLLGFCGVLPFCRRSR